MANSTHLLFSSRKKVDPHSFVGDTGRIFYNEQTGELRLSDGVTPYGLPIYLGGTGVTLERYVEDSVPAYHPIANPSTIALGDGSVARSYGGIVQSSGVFSSPGDAQIGSYIARGITNSNVFEELYLDGSTKQLLVQPNTSIAYTITIIGRRTDGSSNEGAVYEVGGGIDRLDTLVSTRLIGVPTKTVFSEDNPTWDATVIANITNGSLSIQVKGEHGKTIRWVAHIKTVEVSI